jgi:phage-related protein
MPSTLSFSIQYGATKNTTTRVKRLSFGDGYEQVAPDGINVIDETWDVVTVPLRDSVADTLESTLNGLLGEWFYWTPPYGSEGKYRLNSAISRNYVGVSSSTLSFTLKKVYAST